MSCFWYRGELLSMVDQFTSPYSTPSAYAPMGLMVEPVCRVTL